MFIKIKLEPQSLKALSPLKKISYFSIDDDATISHLKKNLEEYVDVPAGRQDIRTLTKVFQNSWFVKEVCDVRGSAIMLYAYDEYYDDPQFVCFLQVYTNELAVQQQELENLSKMPIAKDKLTTPTSSTSSITLIADSDIERDSEGTDTETDSSKNSDSDCTDNSDSSCGKKRSKHGLKNVTQNKKLKVAASSGSQYSETLCQYLDEFPKCSKQLNSTDVSDNKTLKPASSECPNKDTISDENTSLCKTSLNKVAIKDNKKQQENTNTQASLEPNPLNNSSLNSNSNNKIQSNIITTTNNKTNNNNNIHPCYNINPEIRDYLVIISSNDTNTTISNVECEELLVWFFDRFRACDSSSHLQFDNKTAITLFDGKLWIACMNNNTFQWISTSITKYSPKSYKILPLKDSRHLCEVVVPVVSNKKSVLDIFDLLEKQNKNITTLKWSLQSRKPLTAKDVDFNEKAISAFCTNEQFNIVMDTESREYLEKIDFKLNYCFWQIVLKFI